MYLFSLPQATKQHGVCVLQWVMYGTPALLIVVAGLSLAVLGAHDDGMARCVSSDFPCLGALLSKALGGIYLCQARSHVALAMKGWKPELSWPEAGRRDVLIDWDLSDFQLEGL